MSLTQRSRPRARQPAEPADARLDEALEETFPASDPIAVHPTDDAATTRSQPRNPPAPDDKPA